MLLKQITLKNFRNFKNETFQFSPFLTVIIGENARGKTNLLEGVYFLANGTGFRESKEEDLVDFESRLSCSVEGIFTTDQDKNIFTISLIARGEQFEKVFQIQRAKKRQSDYISNNSRTVLFSPEQIEIIIGPADRRRDYFNRLISSFDWEYKKKLRNFEQALRKRNKLLESYHDFVKLTQELEFWNSYLEEQASYIFQKRDEQIAYLNQNNKLENKEFFIDYLKSDLTAEKLKENLEKELRIRRTLIGPQKDDFQIYIKAPTFAEASAGRKNIHHFGSRSEQRLSVLWLKISEVNFYENFYKRKPLLLLDDIFSELDLKNKKLVLQLIKKYQTVATTTDSEVLGLADVPKSIIKL